MTTLVGHRGLLLQRALENPKASCQDPKGVLYRSSSPADPIVEDPLLQVHTVAGVGPH